MAAAGPDPVAEAAPRVAGESALAPLLLDASARTGVPAEVLATVAYVETRLQAPPPHAHHEDDGHHQAPVIGLMALTEGAPRPIARAARLAGVSEHDARVDPAANILAAAALLAEHAGDPRSLADWGPALEAYGGASLAREVMRRIDRGWVALDGEARALLVPARPTGVAAPVDGFGQRALALGYPGAGWAAAHGSNYSDGNRGAGSIDYIVVHTMQGSYAGTISWFKDPTANVSSHYVIRSSDGEVTQMVDDRDVAWHDACFNSYSIGIEHEGWVDAPDTWYTDAMYMESARLTAWLADQYGIPKTREHILGHGETPDCSSHTDPGAGWDWDKYMGYVQSGGQPVYEASYVGQDTPATLAPGEEAVVWFELENESNLTWDIDTTRLATTPDDRASAFYVADNWISPSRATGADHSTYSPGKVGRFTFLIRAPQVEEPTTFTETFRLVQEGHGAFGPELTMQIEVVPPGSGSAGGTIDPGGAGVGGEPGGAPEDLHAGCAAGGTGSTACAILLAGALVLVRRRAGRAGRLR